MPETIYECDRLDRWRRRTPQQLLAHVPQPPQARVAMHAHAANRNHGVMQRPYRDPKLSGTSALYSVLPAVAATNSSNFRTSAR